MPVSRFAIFACRIKFAAPHKYECVSIAKIALTENLIKTLQFNTMYTYSYYNVIEN